MNEWVGNDSEGEGKTRPPRIFHLFIIITRNPNTISPLRAGQFLELPLLQQNQNEWSLD